RRRRGPSPGVPRRRRHRLRRPGPPRGARPRAGGARTVPGQARGAALGSLRSRRTLARELHCTAAGAAVSAREGGGVHPARRTRAIRLPLHPARRELGAVCGRPRAPRESSPPREVALPAAGRLDRLRPERGGGGGGTGGVPATPPPPLFG